MVMALGALKLLGSCALVPVKSIVAARAAASTVHLHADLRAVVQRQA